MVLTKKDLDMAISKGLAGFGHRMDGFDKRMDGLESRIDEMNTRMMTNFDGLFKKFEMLHEENILFRSDIRNHDGRLTGLEQRVTKLEARA